VGPVMGEEKEEEENQRKLAAVSRAIILSLSVLPHLPTYHAILRVTRASSYCCFFCHPPRL